MLVDYYGINCANKKELIMDLFIDIFTNNVGKILFTEQNDDVEVVIEYLVSIGFIRIGDTKGFVDKKYEVFFTHSIAFTTKKYEYNSGDYVYYKLKKELGKVKRIGESGSIFVWYHIGDTAACTPKQYMRTLIPNAIAQELEESEIYTILEYISNRKYKFSTDVYTIHEIIKKVSE